MKKKYLLVLLCLTLAAALLTACAEQTVSELPQPDHTEADAAGAPTSDEADKSLEGTPSEGKSRAKPHQGAPLGT